MKKACLLGGLLFCLCSSADQVGIGYLTSFYGHLHKNPSRYSSSLTTLSCGHPLSMRDAPEIPSGWVKVKTSGETGFIMSRYVALKRPECFQAKYPKFSQSFNLDPSDLYYWGRLYDHYVAGKTKAPGND